MEYEYTYPCDPSKLNIFEPSATSAVTYMQHAHYASSFLVHKVMYGCLCTYDSYRETLNLYSISMYVQYVGERVPFRIRSTLHATVSIQ